MEHEEGKAINLKQVLAQFSGTEYYHQLTTLPMKCTDGIAYLAKEAQAYWLLDLIASYKPIDEFEVWKLEKTLKGKGNDLATRWVVSRGTGMDDMQTIQTFEYSDFPLDVIMFYRAQGVLMLPNEY